MLRTPIRAPRANAICERLIGSLRCECLDHILLVSEAHLRRMPKSSRSRFLVVSTTRIAGPPNRIWLKR